MLGSVLPPSGEQFTIGSDGYEAVVTEAGATLRALTLDGRPLLDGFGEDEQASAGKGQLLMPWPNRIRDGRYDFGGRTHQLPISEVGRSNASHGLVRWVSWSPLEVAPDRVRLGYRLPAQSGYPWVLDLEVTYALGPDGLQVTQRATNRAATPAPYAAGAHPYLTLGPGGVDTWTLTVPATTALTTDDRMLPTGQVEVAGGPLDYREPRVIGENVLDTCYGGLLRDPDGRATARLTDGVRTVELWVDESWPWLMVYTGDAAPEPRAAVAVEPMTAPVDAFRSGTDVVVLEPGEQHAARWGIRAGA